MDVQKVPNEKFKKQYIAAGALALLVAAGGTTGALITAESTIANNTIHADVAPTPVGEAVVTATGTAIEHHAVKQDSYNWIAGDIKTVPFTVTNTGNATATVKATPKATEITRDTPVGPFFAYLRLADSPPTTAPDTLPANLGSWNMLGNSNLENMFTNGGHKEVAFDLAPRESKTVYVTSVIRKEFLDMEDSGSMKLTYDIAFDYVTKGA